ncbi:MAG TPA: hypothetical protein VIV64_00885 [Gammaproteobacteria bacterium]|jgi:hypothetical protein
MRSRFKLSLLALSAVTFAGCGGQQSADEPAAEAAPPAAATHYKPVATVLDLMRGTLSYSALTYWQSVSIVVDADGIHENQPETEEEWEAVWAAGLTLAESGNLLMMPPRLIDEEDWIRMSTNLVDVGLRAAQVAIDEDFEGVLALGEEIYNVCVECHRTYVPTLSDL